MSEHIKNEPHETPRFTVDFHARIYVKTGVALILASLIIFLAVVFPVLLAEIKYFLGSGKGNRQSMPQVVLESSMSEAINADAHDSYIIPVDTEYGLVIPKIKANSKVIPDVDPFNSKEYQQKLTLGVAHAKGTARPDEKGNVFLFSHSSDTLYNANRYNSVFYLLNKLVPDDEFYIFYHDKEYRYLVTSSAVVEPDQVQYLKSQGDKNTATLMTCWPMGTTLKRLVVIGELVE